MFYFIWIIFGLCVVFSVFNVLVEFMEKRLLVKWFCRKCCLCFEEDFYGVKDCNKRESIVEEENYYSVMYV